MHANVSFNITWLAINCSQAQQQNCVVISDNFRFSLALSRSRIDVYANMFSIAGKLQKFEVPAAVTLCKEVWSPDMGLVTAAFKLKRKDIQDRYQHDINRMYAS